ncbi:Uncharacterised protein [Mycobacteroides abscessus]|nr:Uncharacterised protein [Mycobacteroides abscessus]
MKRYNTRRGFVKRQGRNWNTATMSWSRDFSPPTPKTQKAGQVIAQTAALDTRSNRMRTGSFRRNV